MLRVLIVAAFTIAIAFRPFGAAQNRTLPKRNQPGKIEETILRIERETFAAITNKDAKALERILADDFIYRDHTGTEADKAELLKMVTSLPVEILSIWGDSMKVQVYGDTAVLTGVQRAKTRNSDGKEETSATAFTDIFVKRRGRWLMVLAYGVELPAGQPATL